MNRMQLTKRKNTFECHLCHCTYEDPCSPNETGLNCRDYQIVIDDECVFCTRPHLKLINRRPRIVGKLPINRKYLTRIDTNRSHGYQLRLILDELGKDVKGRTKSLSAWFSDKRYNGKAGALREALRVRDQAIIDFGLSLERKTRPIGPNVNIHWLENARRYDVRICHQGQWITNRFSIKTWVSRDVALMEARRWRDMMRADLGLSPAPNAMNVTFSLDTQVTTEEIVEQIMGQRPLIRASLSKQVTQAPARWVTLLASGQVQMSNAKRGKGKW